MSDASQEAEKAKEQAGQAGHQARAAAKSTGRAAKAATEPVAEAVADGARDVADKVEGTAQDAAEATKRGVNAVNVGVLGHISGDLGVGFLALSVSIYSGLVAYGKFRQVVAHRSQVIR